MEHVIRDSRKIAVDIQRRIRCAGAIYVVPRGKKVFPYSSRGDLFAPDGRFLRGIYRRPVVLLQLDTRPTFLKNRTRIAPWLSFVLEVKRARATRVLLLYDYFFLFMDRFLCEIFPDIRLTGRFYFNWFDISKVRLEGWFLNGECMFLHVYIFIDKATIFPSDKWSKVVSHNTIYILFSLAVSLKHHLIDSAIGWGREPEVFNLVLHDSVHNWFGGDQEAKRGRDRWAERRDRGRAGWNDDSSAPWNILTIYNWNCLANRCHWLGGCYRAIRAWHRYTRVCRASLFYFSVSPLLS